MAGADAFQTASDITARGQHDPIEQDDGTRRTGSCLLTAEASAAFFRPRFWRRWRSMCNAPIASYFDLIAGTSTGGVIAIGLGLGVPASEILRLYEQHGPAIFDQAMVAVEDWLRQRLRGFRHCSTRNIPPRLFKRP